MWRAEALPHDSPTLIATDAESFDPSVAGQAPQLRGWVDLDEAGAKEWVL